MRQWRLENTAFEVTKGSDLLGYVAICLLGYVAIGLGLSFDESISLEETWAYSLPTLAVIACGISMLVTARKESARQHKRCAAMLGEDWQKPTSLIIQDDGIVSLRSGDGFRRDNHIGLATIVDGKSHFAIRFTGFAIRLSKDEMPDDLRRQIEGWA